MSKHAVDNLWFHRSCDHALKPLLRLGLLGGAQLQIREPRVLFRDLLRNSAGHQHIESEVARFLNAAVLVQTLLESRLETVQQGLANGAVQPLLRCLVVSSPMIALTRLFRCIER